jgi:ubiquinone biosynthesis protein UbiJ
MLPFPFLPNPIRLAVRALNALLGREEWARDRLSRHGGKTVRFVLGAMKANLSIDGQGYTDIADEAIVPDVTLTVPLDKFKPAQLFGRQAANASARERADAFADMTHISGDAGLAQVVAELAAHLRWDPEDDLARLVGDIPAARVSAGARAAVAGLRQAVQRLGANAAEYLAHERPVLASRPALEDWRARVAQAAAGVDGLAARLARLEGRVGQARPVQASPARTGAAQPGMGPAGTAQSGAADPARGAAGNGGA